MKMTMHIDDGLLERVMAATGAKSKTMAIDLAVCGMVRCEVGRALRPME